MIVCLVQQSWKTLTWPYFKAQGVQGIQGGIGNSEAGCCTHTICAQADTTDTHTYKLYIWLKIWVALWFHSTFQRCNICTKACGWASAAFLQSYCWAAFIKCLTASPQQSNYPADLWAQTLTSPLKCKRDLKSLACLSIAVGGRKGWVVGASNICLAFIPPYCVVESSIRPTAGILGA